MKNRLPFVVGVTGHRNLQGADEAVAAATRAYLETLAEHMPGTPVVILSSLAEGADQVVAEAALGMRDHPDPRRRLDVELVVPLPRPESTYLKDDFSPAALDRYHRLAGLASRRFVLPEVVRLDPNPDAPWPEGVDPVKLQYVLAGGFIARHCHVLLAVWNGERERGVGGTAQIVRLKRTGRLDALPPDLLKAVHATPHVFGRYDPLAPPDTGPVIQIPIPVPVPGDGKAPFLKLAPSDYDDDPEETRHDADEAEKARDEYFERFEEIHGQNLAAFNAQARGLEADPRERAAAAAEANVRRPPDLPEEPDSPLDECLGTYATADRLAITLKRRIDQFLLVVVGLIALAVAAFGAYAHLVASPSGKVWTLACYLVLLLIADILYLASIRSGHLLRKLAGSRIGKLLRKLAGPSLRGRSDQAQFQDFRTLAEGLRVQFYWAVAGLRHHAADYYLTRQKNELEWIRAATRTWGVLVSPPDRDAPVPSPSDEKPLDAARVKWVLDQLNFYVAGAHANRVKHVALHQVGSGLLGSSLVLALVMVLFEANWAEVPWLSPTILGLVLIGVTLVHGLSKYFESREEADEYETMLNRADQAAQRLPAIKPPEGLSGALRRGWLSPLGMALGGSGPTRPSMRRLSWMSFAYGLILGSALIAVHLAIPRGLLATGPSHEPNPTAEAGATAAHPPAAGHEEAEVERLGFRVEYPEWMIAVMVLNVALSALVQWYAEKRAYGTLARQFRLMAQAFLFGYRTLEQIREEAAPDHPNRERAVLLRLGELSLAEHADWLVLHRDRPLELPKLEL